MKVYIIGSIKIDSWMRKKFFINNLRSLEPASSLWYWNFNMVGKYANSLRQEILKKYPEAHITHDNESSYYALIKNQVVTIGQDPKALLFFLMEDHWFICPHKNVFFYLLEKFYHSTADVLRMTHTTELWEHESAYTVTVDTPLYKECLIDSNGLKNLWSKYPGSYIVSMPGIFKQAFVLELLENNKSLLQSKKPGGFELYGKKAEEFLAKRSFTTMVPTVHILREVFWVNQDKRAMDARKALKMIALRDMPEVAIKPWRKATRLLMEPRVLAGKIKRIILRKK